MSDKKHGSSFENHNMLHTIPIYQKCKGTCIPNHDPLLDSVCVNN